MIVIQIVDRPQRMIATTVQIVNVDVREVSKPVSLLFLEYFFFDEYHRRKNKKK